MTPDYPSRFGVYGSVRHLGDGRFGPVFLAEGPDAATVLVRTFTLPLSDIQRDRLVAALMALCGRPLDHPSIATPLACGVEDGQPYLVHAYLPGDSLADLAKHLGPYPLTDVSVRLTYLAGALDFAAAAGVLHGALSAHDVIVSNESAGVSGFGLVQALESAGIPGFHAQREDDVAALIGIARDLLGDDVPPAVGAVLAAPQPRTALAFAAELQSTLPLDAPVATPAIEELFHRESAPAGRFDFPLPEKGIPLREDATTPGVDVITPRGDATTPSGDATTPSGDVTTPRGDVTTPSGDVTTTGGDFFAIPQYGDADDLAFDPPDAEPLIGERPMFGATPTDIAPVALPVRGRSTRWLITAAVALAFGIFAGFAGGFFVGRDTPLPSDVVATPPPAPEATNGRDFTDAAVDEPKPPAPPPLATSPSPEASQPATSASGVSAPASQAPAASGQPSAGAPPAVGPASSGSPRGAEPPAGAGSSRAEASQDQSRAPSPPAPRATRAQTAPEPPSGPAAMQVDSRPIGAQVFVDGRPVGYTPMVVGDLNPGTHSVRMQIPGYRPWVTAVTLGPGARERVAASLEQ